MTHRRILFYLMIMTCRPMMSAAATPPTAKETIEAFYKIYLRHPSSPLQPAFSKSFRALIDKNTEVCKEKAGTDVCGWEADEDPYLNAQDGDDHLTYARAIKEVKELKPGYIRVRISNLPDTAPNDLRQVDYLMIQENGRWVVDDMIHADQSDRKTIQNDIDQLLKQQP